MKKTRSSLEIVKNFVDSTYSRYGNTLVVDTKEDYDPTDEGSSLGYCFKYIDKDDPAGRVIYKIVCAKVGIERTDFRVLMHEYGHIYLGHLDGIHEELDTQICNLIRDNRGELIDYINKTCGIDFGEKLLDRIIDDPYMNHSLHNIAMDMEVNSEILSKEDIEEMEMDITSIMPKTEEELLKYLEQHAIDSEEKDAIHDALEKAKKQSKVKLIIPERYNLGKDDQGNLIPFPNNLTYPEYLILIFKHIDQFIKMLVSLDMGGNGDTSEITKEMIQEALNRMAQQQAYQNQSDEYKRGYEQALQDIKNGQIGKNATDPNNQQSQEQSGESQSPQSADSSQQGQSSGSGEGQDGQQEGQSESTPSNGNGSQGETGQPSQGGQQGQPGDSGDQMSDYERGYQGALRNAAAGSQGQSGMQGLSQLMGNAGMPTGPDPGQKKGEGQAQKQGGQSPHNGQQSRAGSGDSDLKKDHGNMSRDEADKKRAAGQIQAGGGTGCGKSGGPDLLREVDPMVDEVDMALKEVILNVKNRVVKYKRQVDLMKLWNRGIIRRDVIVPSISHKINMSLAPKVVFLIDVSGSMDTRLVDRILKTIAKSLHRIQRGLKYDIITWSTRLGEHLKDLDPKKPVPKISCGGGTDMAAGMEYFKNNYKDNAILVLISDFEDSLEAWHKVEQSMRGYLMYGFNYGSTRYTQDWTYFKQRDFSNYGYD